MSFLESNLALGFEIGIFLEPAILLTETYPPEISMQYICSQLMTTALLKMLNTWKTINVYQKVIVIPFGSRRSISRGCQLFLRCYGVSFGKGGEQLLVLSSRRRF